ncbi:N-formylglutamate amidohydrolase [Yoonia sp. R2331]|uniref:N-formylglutamate amidohydrolase n=1 Tax=Yoonia sp. R2331 TaxID=3237238 RepID=UPI0034E5A3E0
MTTDATETILSDLDPDPIDIVNPDSRASVVLLCEHAGRAIPKSLGNLGLSEAVINSHRGWDIGAQVVARSVAARLNAPLVLQNYSRLLIDANRPPEGPHAITTEVDGVPVPGNMAISPKERTQRVTEIFLPMDTALSELFARSPRSACFSIHSFNPTLGGGDVRPWDAGFLSRQDTDTAHDMMNVIAGQQPALTLAVNQPYQIDDETDWFIPKHAESRQIAHALIEIRNDNISTDDDCEMWAGLLTDAISAVMEKQT